MRDRAGGLPLRVRLVAGFVVAMLVLLSAAGAFVYWRVEYALDRGLDTRAGAGNGHHHTADRIRRDGHGA